MINKIKTLLIDRLPAYYPELSGSRFIVKERPLIKYGITANIYFFDIYQKNSVFRSIVVKQRVFKQIYNNNIEQDTLTEFENLHYFSQLPNRNFRTPIVIGKIPEEGILISEKVDGRSLYSHLKDYSYFPFLKSKHDLLRDMSIKTGSWLRHFHDAGFSGEEKKIDTNDYLKKAKHIVNKFPQWGLPKQLGEKVIYKMQRLESETLYHNFKVSFKHGDFQPMNILFHKGNVTVLDIDSRSNDLFIKDVGNFITGVETFGINNFFCPLHKDGSREMINYFLNAYFREQPIPYQAITFVRCLGLLENFERMLKRNNLKLKRILITNFFKHKLDDLNI